MSRNLAFCRPEYREAHASKLREHCSGILKLKSVVTLCAVCHAKEAYRAIVDVMYDVLSSSLLLCRGRSTSSTRRELTPRMRPADPGLHRSRATGGGRHHLRRHREGGQPGGRRSHRGSDLQSGESHQHARGSERST